MTRRTIQLAAASIATVLFGGAVLAFQSSPQLPPGHPPTRPVLPPGHPQIEPQQPSETPEVSKANPADVQSVDAIINAYYESISGAKGEARDWGRFQSLFLPSARLMTTRPAGQLAAPVVLTPADYIAANDTYFSGGGYYEQELHRSVDTFGRIAQVFSTYASRRSLEQPPYSRGINSIQLMSDGSRWWIVSVLWDYERTAEGNALPAQYLPPVNVSAPSEAGE